MFDGPHIRKFMEDFSARNEDVIREMLGRWVSELEPAIVWKGYRPVALTLADIPVGAEAPVVVERK